MRCRTGTSTARGINRQPRSPVLKGRLTARQIGTKPNLASWLEVLAGAVLQLVCCIAVPADVRAERPVSACFRSRWYPLANCSFGGQPVTLADVFAVRVTYDGDAPRTLDRCGDFDCIYDLYPGGEDFGSCFCSPAGGPYGFFFSKVGSALVEAPVQDPILLEWGVGFEGPAFSIGTWSAGLGTFDCPYVLPIAPSQPPPPDAFNLYPPRCFSASLPGCPYTYLTGTIIDCSSSLRDPAPDLLDESGQIISPTDLSNRRRLDAEGESRSKLAADGSSKLVLRALAPAGTQPSVAIVGLNAGDGTLRDLTGGESSTFLLPQLLGDFPTAYIEYTAPPDFGDFEGTCRHIMIAFSWDGEDREHFKITLCRQPVLLVHGLWSSPAAWDDPSPISSTITAMTGAAPVRVSYPGQLGFNPSASGRDILPVRILEHRIAQIRNDWEKQGFVRPRVAIVGHSMGGLLPRSLAVRPGYLRRDNYMLGDIQRLITIDSPHLGSLLANLLIGNTCYGNAMNDLLANEIGTALLPAVGAGVRDLQTPSATDRMNALHQINRERSTLRISAIVGMADSAAESANSRRDRFVLNDWYGCEGFQGYRELHGAESDLVVPTASQRGDGIPLSGEVFGRNSRAHSDSYLVNESILHDPAVADRVVTLLNHFELFESSGSQN